MVSLASGNPNRKLLEVGLKLPKHEKSEAVNEKMHRQLLRSLSYRNLTKHKFWSSNVVNIFELYEEGTLECNEDCWGILNQFWILQLNLKEWKFRVGEDDGRKSTLSYVFNFGSIVIPSEAIVDCNCHYYFVF